MSIKTTLFIIIVLVVTVTLVVARRFDEIEIITNNQFLNTRNAIKIDEFKWPKGVIPFTFDDDWTFLEKTKILEAMEIFNRETCISFVRKTKAHRSYVMFKKSLKLCTSSIGYRKQTEPLIVAFSKYCLQRPGTIQHEMLHVIGLVHEQCRSDRDDYINILWENIEEKYFYNFVKVPNTYFDSYNLTYDYKSLMHYPGNAFAKKGQNVTMESKLNPEMKLGQIIRPSFFDLEKVRRMYKCA